MTDNPAVRFLSAAFAVFIFLSGAADVQAKSQQPLIGVVVLAGLNTCYMAPADGVEATDSIALSVDLESHGDFAGLPDLLTPTPLTKGQRALLRALMDAVIDCTPIISGRGDKLVYGHFDVLAGPKGLSLENIDGYVARVETAQPETPEIASDPSGATTKADEEALGLTRAERIEIQRRLVLLDYDTRGVDGVFGKGSRAAIAQWQKDYNWIVSGYLDTAQIAMLREMSQEAYAKWNSQPKRYVDRNGCLREANGVIITGRSLKCDLAAASQGLGLSR